MPVNPVVPDVAEMRVNWRLPLGEEMINVHNCNIGAVATLDFTLANDIAGAWVAAATPTLLTLLANTVSVRNIVVTDLRTANGPAFELAYSPPGTNVDALLPAQVAAVVKWRTTLRGRSFQGRTYLGGFSEAESAGQSPETTTLAALQTFADDLITQLAAVNADLCVVSRYHQVVPGTPPTVPRVTNINTLVTNASVDQAWHTHRSRALKN